MQRRYTFLMLLSIFIVACSVYGIFIIFKVASLPVQVNIVDALRMQAKAKLVDALVQAPLTSLAEVQTQARTLLNAAATG